ncbi:hypothetical protein DFH29DRAFT_164478 [Suillus ampliporus]|nr:hypothetical protein DFH29DRAFT_164478 [Suillus ampliporus]
MHAWTIFPANIPACPQRRERHPMLMKIFRVMKTTYALLDPQNEPRSVNAGKHIATFGCAGSEVFIHFGLSTETSTRFAIVLRDMQIEDKVQNLRILVPLELVPTVADIRDFVLARLQTTLEIFCNETECELARQVWEPVQVQKYHAHLLDRGVIESIDSPDLPRCDLCRSWLYYCGCCRIARCPFSCDGYPPWRKCAIGPCIFYFDGNCAECAVGGATQCVCQALWGCDDCTPETPDDVSRCRRCDRSFCKDCSYIDVCFHCRSSSLCHDCSEEASENARDVKEIFLCKKCTLRHCDQCTTSRTTSCAICKKTYLVECDDTSDCDPCWDQEG